MHGGQRKSFYQSSGPFLKAMMDEGVILPTLKQQPAESGPSSSQRRSVAGGGTQDVDLTELLAATGKPEEFQNPETRDMGNDPNSWRLLVSRKDKYIEALMQRTSKVVSRFVAESERLQSDINRQRKERGILEEKVKELQYYVDKAPARAAAIALRNVKSKKQIQSGFGLLETLPVGEMESHSTLVTDDFDNADENFQRTAFIVAMREQDDRIKELEMLLAEEKDSVANQTKKLEVETLRYRIAYSRIERLQALCGVMTTQLGEDTTTPSVTSEAGKWKNNLRQVLESLQDALSSNDAVQRDYESMLKPPAEMNAEDDDATSTPLSPKSPRSRKPGTPADKGKKEPVFMTETDALLSALSAPSSSGLKKAPGLTKEKSKLNLSPRKGGGVKRPYVGKDATEPSPAKTVDKAALTKALRKVQKNMNGLRAIRQFLTQDVVALQANMSLWIKGAENQIAIRVASTQPPRQLQRMSIASLNSRGAPQISGDEVLVATGVDVSNPQLATGAAKEMLSTRRQSILSQAAVAASAHYEKRRSSEGPAQPLSLQGRKSIVDEKQVLPSSSATQDHTSSAAQGGSGSSSSQKASRNSRTLSSVRFVQPTSADGDKPFTASDTGSKDVRPFTTPSEEQEATSAADRALSPTMEDAVQNALAEAESSKEMQEVKALQEKLAALQVEKESLATEFNHLRDSELEKKTPQRPLMRQMGCQTDPEPDQPPERRNVSASKWNYETPKKPKEVPQTLASSPTFQYHTSETPPAHARSPLARSHSPKKDRQHRDDPATTPVTRSQQLPVAQLDATAISTAATPTGSYQQSMVPTPPQHVPSQVGDSSMPLRGESSPGNLPGGHPPPGHLPAEHPPAGQLATGNLPTGHPPAGHPPAGQLPPGQLSTGHLPAGQLSTGQLSTGNLPAGQLSTGQLSTGQLSTGNLAMGQLTPHHPEAITTPSRTIYPSQLTLPTQVRVVNTIAPPPSGSGTRAGTTSSGTGAVGATKSLPPSPIECSLCSSATGYPEHPVTCRSCFDRVAFQLAAAKEYFETHTLEEKREKQLQERLHQIEREEANLTKRISVSFVKWIGTGQLPPPQLHTPVYRMHTTTSETRRSQTFRPGSRQRAFLTTVKSPAKDAALSLSSSTSFALAGSGVVLPALNPKPPATARL